MKINHLGRNFWITAHPTEPQQITAHSTKREDLEEMLDSIELQGRADDLDFDDLAIRATNEDDPAKRHFEMTMDRGTLILYFSFEINHFI